MAGEDDDTALVGEDSCEDEDYDDFNLGTNGKQVEHQLKSKGLNNLTDKQPAHSQHNLMACGSQSGKYQLMTCSTKSTVGNNTQNNDDIYLLNMGNAGDLKLKIP